MCGIGGILRLDGAPTDARLLDAMATSLAHRGPDGSGTWLEGPVGLANRRLAVIGLGAQGHQPMSDHDGRAWITYNGEIYNYRELRSELTAAGRRFRSETDTEVVLAAYLEWGATRCLQRLNGMFAFAIWDRADRALLLARDRLGIKPLYVERTRASIAFASELEALAAAREGAAEIDPVALDAYFAYGYVPQPRTIFRSVTAVEAGTVTTFVRGAESTSRYWLLEPGPSLTRDPKDAAALTRTAVERAVGRQLVGDVTCGIFLSGGLDSSIIASAAARDDRTIEAVTVRFAEPGFDESNDAAATAAHLGIRHHVVDVGPDLWSTMPHVVRSYGQPFADSSALAVYALSAAARTHMTVALSGDGGDELFGGYPTYLASALAGWYRAMPWPLRSMLRAAIGQAPADHSRLGIAERALRFVTAAESPQPAAHLRWREHFGPEMRARLLRRDVVAGPEEHFAAGIDAAATFDGLDRYLALDTLAYLPSDMLCKVDIASMQHGLEVRLPLLDHELVELAFRLPHQLKRDAFSGKKVLRAAFADALPRSVRRGRKRGFNVPIARWLAGPLYETARDALDPQSEPMRLLDGGTVRRLLEDHRARRRDNGYQLWSVLAFCIWYEGARRLGPGLKG